MPQRPSVTSRTRGDNHKSAIGDVVLRILRRGDKLDAAVISATLTREGGDRAAHMIEAAMDEAKGKKPPTIIVTKPRKR